MSQLPLFDDADDLPPQAGRLAPRLRALADREIYFGTSSWKYPGWLGSIYSPARYTTRGKFSKARFEENCLAEYAAVFPVVCGDFAFYQFPSNDSWRKLFQGTPGPLKFAFKVPEDITVATWPGHPRYGSRGGEANPNFLDARVFDEHFASPLSLYRDRVATLIFEFGTFNKSTFANPGDFMARLDPFLAALPTGFRYGVEIRNPEFLIPDYLELLRSRNVAHVFNAWTRMPPLEEQAQLSTAFTADFTVVRALLKKGRAYEQAVRSFEPYERTQEVNEGAREGIRSIIESSLARKTPAFVFVNNRLEGNAPCTIEAIVDRITTSESRGHAS